MKITAENDRCLSVELTGDDMRKLDITYEELDYANIETRRVLWTLLDEARRTLGKSISLSDQLVIETTPAREGGCRIVFTSVPEEESENRHLRFIAKTGKLFWEFVSADALLDFWEKAVLPPGCRLTVYYNDGKYRALAETDPSERQTVLAAAEEFGTVLPVSEEQIAQTREGWRILYETPAVPQTVN